MNCPTFPKYSWLDFVFTIIGVCTFVFDVGSDLWVAKEFYTHGNIMWFGVVVGFMLMSSVIIQMFSWFWLQYDRKLEDFDCQTSAGYIVLFGGAKQVKLSLLLHVCQLGFFIRHISAIWQGFCVQWRGGSGSEYAVYLTHDLSMLRLIETFCESAPQLTLMMYIILRSNHARIVQLLIQVFSWLWYSDSLEQLQTHVEKYVNRHNLLKAFHVMQFGVFVRYAGQVEISTCRICRQTKGSPKSDNKLKRDLCMLRLIEAFSENAPQLTLMMSIIAKKQELQLFTGLKTLVSAAGIAVSVVMYHRSMQKFLHEQCKLSWISSGFYYFFWNLLLIIPRVSALALFISVLPCYIVAHFLSLWMLLVLGVWSQKTDFMEGSCWEWLYRATVGLIWYFSWFNVGSGSTKLKSIVYYTFMGLDTMMLLGFWCWKMQYTCISNLFKPHIVIPVLVGLYILGIILRIIYYKNFHPTCDKEKIGELHQLEVTERAAAACIDLEETDSAQDISPEAPAPTQPVTGAQRRMRIMAANFYY